MRGAWPMANFTLAGGGICGPRALGSLPSSKTNPDARGPLVSANLCDVRFRRRGYYLALVLEGESEPTDYTDYSDANYSDAADD